MKLTLPSATGYPQNAYESTWCRRTFFHLLAYAPISDGCLLPKMNTAVLKTRCLAMISGNEDCAATRQLWGKTIRLGGLVFTIVGVSPQAFNGLAVDTSPHLRVPASVDLAS